MSQGKCQALPEGASGVFRERDKTGHGVLCDSSSDRIPFIRWLWSGKVGVGRLEGSEWAS